MDLNFNSVTTQVQKHPTSLNAPKYTVLFQYITVDILLANSLNSWGTQKIS